MKISIARSTFALLSLILARGGALGAQAPNSTEQPHKKMGWVRSYGGTLGPQGPKLERGSTRWAEVPNELKPTSSSNVWVEYLPLSGQSIWVPGYVTVTAWTSTTDDPAPKRPVPVAGSPGFQGSFSFSILGDIDGKGYRIWSKDRMLTVGEEFLPELPSPLEMTLESFRGDAVIIHVAHPFVKSLSARFSADGENWTYARGFSNHATPIVNPAAPEDWAHSNARIPERVLSKNPNPWVEVDLIVGLQRIIRRFQFGVSPSPVPGAFHASVPVGAEEDYRREKDAYNIKIKEAARKLTQEQINNLPEKERIKEEEKWRRMEALEEENRQYKERDEKGKSEKMLETQGQQTEGARKTHR